MNPPKNGLNATAEPLKTIGHANLNLTSTICINNLKAVEIPILSRYTLHGFSIL